MKSKLAMTVFRPAGHALYRCQWRDPVTGKKKTKTTDADTKKAALIFAGRKEAEILAGNFRNGETSWEELKTRYVADVLSGQSPRSLQTMQSTFNAVDDLISPKLAKALDANEISKFQSDLRASGLAEATIKRHLRCLKAILNWGAEMNLLDKAPKVKMPIGADGMKGRAPTGEEFERMKAATAAVVGERLAADWIWDLEGLWWSGLRLGEAIALDWNDDRKLAVDYSHEFPMFRIQAQGEKGRQFRILPMAPEFANHLASVPAAERRGPVFRFRPLKLSDRPTLNWISEVICAIGEKAGVKVSERRRRPDAEAQADGSAGPGSLAVKHASAHDLRRAFGERWARRPEITPQMLMEMMRHSSIATTMQFYVGRNAERTAKDVWGAFAKAAGAAGNGFANKSANNGQSRSTASGPKSRKSSGK